MSEFPSGVEESKLASIKKVDGSWVVVDFSNKFGNGELLLARNPVTGIRGWVVLESRVGRNWSFNYTGVNYVTPTTRPVCIFPRTDKFVVREHVSLGARIAQLGSVDEVGPGSQVLISGKHYTLTSWDWGCEMWHFTETPSTVARLPMTFKVAKSKKKPVLGKPREVAPWELRDGLLHGKDGKPAMVIHLDGERYMLEREDHYQAWAFKRWVALTA